jgi:disulfide oxidoreductase YuzD
MNKRQTPIKWRKEPEDHDYPAALSYLRLTFNDKKADQIVRALRRTPMTSFKAKDIFRASGLSLLGVSNTHVEANNRKIAAGEDMSPLLLVRRPDKVIVADGYHRLCSVYQFNEDVVVPCKIV